MRTCDIDGCDKKHYGKGLCKNHHSRLLRHGDPLKVINEYDVLKRLEDGAMPIPECGCFIWEGDGQKYGKMSVNGKPKCVHRVAYEAYVGAIPPNKLVLHKCDTPRCINPHHLYVGTYSDNSRDASIRGRNWKKISPDDMKEIIEMRKNGFSYSKIARKFNVTHASVRGRVEYLKGVE